MAVLSNNDLTFANGGGTPIYPSRGWFCYNTFVQFMYVDFHEDEPRANDLLC